jgi:NDP-sugar pyrophosphorylase family protein
MAGFGEVTAIVLAGGKGTRLSSIYPDLPKPMVPMCGRPFLHWVTAWLVRQNVRDIVYSLGHRAEQIETWMSSADFGSDVRLRCQRESAALGTGGAIVNCLKLCSDPVLALNGDSLVLAPLAPMAARLDATVDGVLRGVAVDEATRYGTLEVGPDGLLRRFLNNQPGRGLINGGVYLMRQRFFSAHAPAGQSSMENDLLPAALANGARIAVDLPAQSPFLDIGTPGSVVRAEAFIAKHAAMLN